MPPPPAFEVRIRALAALDTVLCDDWEGRYYSFDPAWAPGLRMGSMRNGEGDCWFFLSIDGIGAGLVGLGHESEAAAAGAVDRSLVPSVLEKDFMLEPAFDTANASFIGWYLPTAAHWALSPTGLEDGAAELLAAVLGGASEYVRYAEDYFEVSVDASVVAEVLAGEPVTMARAMTLNPGAAWEVLEPQLRSMGVSTS